VLLVGGAMRLVGVLTGAAERVAAGVGWLFGAVDLVAAGARAVGVAARVFPALLETGLTAGMGERAPLRTTEPTVASGVGWGI
jgi:hypothetical protein